MIIDAVIWKLEHTSVEENDIGRYARLVRHKMMKRDFDLTLIDNRFHLHDKPQIREFCKCLFNSYVELETTGEIKLKLAPVILCVKLGQVQTCFELVHKTQGKFRDEF